MMRPTSKNLVALKFNHIVVIVQGPFHIILIRITAKLFYFLAYEPLPYHYQFAKSFSAVHSNFRPGSLRTKTALEV